MYLGNTPTQQAFTPAVDVFSGNGSTTAFTLSRQVASVAQVQAFIENVPQSPVDAFTVSGNTITFTSAPPSGSSNIYVRYTSPITQTIAPSDGSVGLTALSTAVTTAYSGQGFKNRIINGDMRIDQRNAGASVTPANGAYTLDRYIVIAYQASKFTVQQNAGSVTPPAGFVNYLGVTSSSAYTVGSGEYFMVGQRIEGNNLSDLAWGTANASTVTLSFKVYSSLTGTFGGSLINGAATRSYPFSFTVSSANTWTTVSITVAGDTSGTWAATTGTGMSVCFNLGAGSTFSGTANTWQAGQIQAPTSSVSVVGTSGATFYITGVQLEKGSNATSYDFRSYGTELALCQRYFEILGDTTQQSIFWDGYQNQSGNNCIVVYAFKATKRAACTMALVGSIANLNTSAVSLNGYTNTAILTPTSSAAGRCYWYTTTNSYITASAEL